MGEYTKNLQLYKADTLEDGNDTFNINRMLNDNWDKIDEMLKKLPVQNGGLYINDETTEEDKAEAQNALFRLGYAVKSYLGFTNIGLENGSETIENIANKLPAWSELITPIGSSNNTTIYPTTYGSLRAIKYDNSNRVFFEFTKKGFNQKWCGVYDFSISAPWSGWVETANPAGYLPLDGSVPMSGKVLDIQNGYGRIRTEDALIQIEAVKLGAETADKLMIQINNTANIPLSSAVRFVRVKDGQTNYYNIFGEHNTELLATQIQSLIDSGVIDVGGLMSPIKIQYSRISSNKTMSGTGKGKLFITSGYIDSITIDGVKVGSLGSNGYEFEVEFKKSFEIKQGDSSEVTLAVAVFY